MSTGFTGRLGRIDRVIREDQQVLSQDVPLELEHIKAAWPSFEAAFDSLQGRKMAGLIYNTDHTYRLTSQRLTRDTTVPVGMNSTTTPGGNYLRLRLLGEPPGVYDHIADAFDELFEHADHDPTRPLIEYYHSEGRVDCLVPSR